MSGPCQDGITGRIPKNEQFVYKNDYIEAGKDIGHVHLGTRIRPIPIVMVGAQERDSVKTYGKAGSPDRLELDWCAPPFWLESEQAPPVSDLHPPARLTFGV